MLKVLVVRGVPEVGDLPKKSKFERLLVEIREDRGASSVLLVRRKTVWGTIPSFCSSIPVVNLRFSVSSSMVTRVEKLL